ncbi:hypothetical protein [Pseudonocardia sp. WMMC193]|uniref:hypothetical protein n=1 Tax=Pseudonocardia sp. WMMC193 TaxID=2911965 RepID=UPI001F1B10C8|nr:hypothetical protein [Pseudonocardia sp. WMMC193]MCF7548894.1 hypothetical protein [Pseudonocardia sp. WMMC193]
MSSYVDPASLVPLFDPSSGGAGQFQMGRLTAWNGTTRANTVNVLTQNRTNLPVLSSAEATLAAPCTVLLVPVGPTYVIVGRIRVP